MIHQIVIVHAYPAPGKTARTRWAHGDRFGERQHAVCPACGSLVPYAPPMPDLRVTDGTKWPDFIGASQPYIGFHVSRRVVDALIANKITGFTTGSMGLIEVSPGRLRQNPPPEYLDIRFEHRVPIDYERMGSRAKEWCQVCDTKLDKPQSFVDVLHRPESVPRVWSRCAGYDLFLPSSNCYSPVYCSERIVDIANREQWTGVAFSPHPQAR